MAVQIKWRRDTAANWSTNNPTLAAGEPGFETDTGQYKIGDGTSAWNSLAHGSFSANPLAVLFADQSSGTDPAAPSAGNLLLYGKTTAGRMMLKYIDPSGMNTAVQPFFGRTKAGYWNPQGNSATLPAVFGFASPTVVGTATAANVATTNLFTRMRRISFVSAATVGSLCGSHLNTAGITLGDGFGNGGFYKLIRFGCSDPATVAGARMFCGVSQSAGTPANAEPSTFTNLIGIGHGAADTSMSIYYGGSTAQAPIALGANFPANTLSADVYELALYAPPNQYAIYYEVTVLNSGYVASGVIQGDGAGTVLPVSSMLMTISQNWRTNNATALAVSLDIMSEYIETDY
ncbi:MAG: hypothetical protein WDN27_00435 [Candidatus Saccharibacteria bacterium]